MTFELFFFFSVDNMTDNNTIKKILSGDTAIDGQSPSQYNIAR
jgi:hypothetical protein